MHSSLIPHPPSLHLSALPPLSLYVHIPWCARKCPYCDFNSHEARAAIPEERYVAALIADLDQAVPQVWGRRVHSVFFGGGTPSLFSARAIDTILASVRARLIVEPDAEITLEANPGTVEAETFRDFRAAGVNRLSLGIQSFDPRHLKALGRIHDGHEARRAIEIARHDFDNVNLDLMYGLPGQTVEEALSDVEQALARLQPELAADDVELAFLRRLEPLVRVSEVRAGVDHRRAQDDPEEGVRDVVVVADGSAIAPQRMAPPGQARITEGFI